MESKVYLYSRVSTDAQTLAQQERTAYEWLNSHSMQVTEVVSDEGVSGGVSFKDRNLGKVLLPKMHAGDVLIVSEVSRLGRSMYDLSKLIHTELKPRKIRLICVSMGIDLRCDQLTAIDELILNNFSFAAQLEKQLISERTLSALQVRRNQGVPLGGAAPKWKETYNNKTENQRKKEAMEKGERKRANFQDKRDTKTFLEILKKEFPSLTKGNPEHWQWTLINCKRPHLGNMLGRMQEYKTIDNRLFARWNFDLDCDQKLRCYMHTIKRSYGAVNC